jgi:transcriptional regulator with GAF, ATPase, and Fis domain
MRVDENEFFRQAVFRICNNLEFEIALQECLLYLRSYMPADMFHLTIYDRGLGALRNIVVATPMEARKVDTVIPLDDEARKFLDKKAVNGSFIIDLSEARSLTRFMARTKGLWKDHSAMVMHLAVKGSRPGNLIMYAKGKNRYSEAHRRLFSILNEPFAIALSNALRFDELNRLKDTLTEDLHYLHLKLLRTTGKTIIGEDFGLRKVMDMVRGVAPLDSPVLLLGETGVGKEIVANAIHNMSRRQKGAFIQINCGAIPETLIDSELFGHEKGAFTGAVTQKRGCFERACGGTIFLDEVAELPPQAQVRMLRVLQEKQIVRVGGGDCIYTDMRVIAATHQDLGEMVATKQFRADLRYRLNVFPITIPPLRERKEDIPALVHHFIAKKSKELQIQDPPRLVPGAMEPLYAYDWPGNVRELENVIERALILKRSGPLVFDDLVRSVSASPAEVPVSSSSRFARLDEVMANHIRQALQVTRGKIHGPHGAAALLGINPSTLRHRMRKLGIRPTDSTISPRHELTQNKGIR